MPSGKSDWWKEQYFVLKSLERGLILWQTRNCQKTKDEVTARSVWRVEPWDLTTYVVKTSHFQSINNGLAYLRWTEKAAMFPRFFWHLECTRWSFTGNWCSTMKAKLLVYTNWYVALYKILHVYFSFLYCFKFPKLHLSRPFFRKLKEIQPPSFQCTSPFLV